MRGAERDYFEELRGLAPEEAVAIPIVAVPPYLQLGFLLDGRGRLSAAGDAQFVTWGKECSFLVA